MSTINYDEIMSPCKNICQLDSEGNYCIGCFRSYEEKKTWWKFTKEEKLKILEELKLGHKRFH